MFKYIKRESERELFPKNYDRNKPFFVTAY